MKMTESPYRHFYFKHEQKKLNESIYFVILNDQFKHGSINYACIYFETHAYIHMHCFVGFVTPK